jgi:hypothetical protein
MGGSTRWCGPVYEEYDTEMIMPLMRICYWPAKSPQ